jgi:hypothetical protein
MRRIIARILVTKLASVGIEMAGRWAVSGNTNSNNAGAAIPLLRIQRSKIRKPWVKRQPLRPEKRWQ